MYLYTISIKYNLKKLYSNIETLGYIDKIKIIILNIIINIKYKNKIKTYFCKFLLQYCMHNILL